MREIKAFFQDTDNLCILHYNMDMDTSGWCSLEQTAVEKVKKAYQHLQHPVFAESTGLCIEGTSVFPGALTKEFLQAGGEAAILALAKDKTVTAETVIAYHNGSDIQVFRGQITGTVQPTSPGDTGGFGWDSLFIPDTATIPFSQMDMATKARYSMRTLALQQILPK